MLYRVLHYRRCNFEFIFSENILYQKILLLKWLQEKSEILKFQYFSVKKRPLHMEYPVLGSTIL